MRNQPSPEEKAKAFDSFRNEVGKVVDGRPVFLAATR